VSRYTPGASVLISAAALTISTFPSHTTPAAKRTEIKAGMTNDEVRRALGEPEAEVVFGEKTRWSYPGMTIVFTRNKVTDVQF